MTKAHAIIAGGGTAGHVVPGLAIASELVARRAAGAGALCRLGPRYRDPPCSRGWLPADRLAGARDPAPPDPGERPLVFGLLAAIVAGVRLVRRLRPAVVVGLGGYASVPCVIGAVLWRVPIVVAEQNAVPGAANRLAGRFAKACAVSFEGVDLPNAIWTGNPVRPEVRALATPDPDRRAGARRALGVPDDHVFFAIFGGSLGARRINHAAADAAPRWSDRVAMTIRHVSGTRDHAAIAERLDLPADAAFTHQLIEYEDDMPTVYAAADFVVCRAGASSVAEVALPVFPACSSPAGRTRRSSDRQRPRTRRRRCCGACRRR